jgi:hypothetical protein
MSASDAIRRHAEATTPTHPPFGASCAFAGERQKKWAPQVRILDDDFKPCFARIKPYFSPSNLQGASGAVFADRARKDVNPDPHSDQHGAVGAKKSYQQ